MVTFLSMKNIKNKEKHLKRYIGLALIFFAGELLVQLAAIFYGVDISIGDFVFPQTADYGIIFISIAMIFMGVFYFKETCVDDTYK